MIQNEVVNVRIFTEEVSFKGSDAVPTGKVVEIPIFTSVVWSTSSDFRKTATITLDNALEKITSTVRYPDNGYSDNISYDFITELYAKDLFERYKDSQVYLNPDIDLLQDSSQFLLNDDFVPAVSELEGFVYTDNNRPFSFLCNQRIWILSSVINATSGVETKKHNVWSGVVSGFSDNFSEGGCTVTINVSGLSRFLELTNLFNNYRYSFYKDTLFEKYLKEIQDNLYSFYSGTDILTRLNPVGILLFPIFLANFYFTGQGHNYNYSKSFSDRVGDFFLQEPLWFLNTSHSEIWDQIKTGKVSAFSNESLQPFSSDSDINQTIQDLIEGNDVETWQLIPSVYLDPVIEEIYTEGSESDLQIFQLIFQQTFELTDNSSMVAKEFLIKAAQAIMANVYEDDFGNIVFEVAKTWSSPASTHGFIADTAYRDSEYSDILHDPDHKEEYIIPDSDYFTHGKSFNEANIVTHVEVPTGFSFEMASQSELIKDRYLTGRTRASDEDVLNMQRRYGVRLLTLNPVTLSKYNLGLESSDKFLEVLDRFAKNVFLLRNYAAHALTIETKFKPFLSVNKNILWLHDEALWLIKDKTLSYTVGDTSGSYSCNFICTLRHKITDKATYPFMDILIEKGGG